MYSPKPSHSHLLPTVALKLAKDDALLEFHVWTGAADLLIQWALTLDHDGTVSAWMTKHFQWCNQKVTRDGEDWALIRSFDIAARKEYHIRPYAFSAKVHRDRLIDHERFLTKKKALAQASSSSRGGGGGGGGRQQGAPSGNGRSFREGQSSKSASLCLICGHQGHRSDSCHAPTVRGGGELHSKSHNGKIVSIAGSKPGEQVSTAAITPEPNTSVRSAESPNITPVRGPVFPSPSRPEAPRSPITGASAPCCMHNTPRAWASCRPGRVPKCCCTSPLALGFEPTPHDSRTAVLTFPSSGSGSEEDPYVYPYDDEDVFAAVATTGMPFHPLTKKGQPFGTSFDYVGMYWDLAARTVGVREEKRRKFLFRADCFLAFFSTPYYPAVVSVASREEEQRKRALARRASDSAPPRTSLAHSSHVSASSSHASLLSSTSITATDSVTDSCNHDPPLSLSSASDVLTSRPSVGRTVIARGPRLAKDSHFIKSTLRPENVPAHMRIAHWITPWSLRQLDDMRLELPASAIRKVNEVLIQSWSQSTRTTQGAALLRFTEHCDELGISEDARMPASSYLLASFVAKHAGSVSESSIDGWMASLHAWHTVNNAPWKGDSKFVSQVKKGAVKLAPPPKPPRKPVTLEYMKVLQRGLNMFDPFDAAVWAVGTCAFWGCCRLGELTVEFDGFVDPKLSVLSEGVWHPMTKSKFLDRCNDIWTSAGLEELDGHAFRIGGSTELLLGGVPPHVVAMVGRPWTFFVLATCNCSRLINVDDVSIARSVVGWNGVPAQLDSVLVVSFALGWWFHGSSAAGNLWRSAFSSVYLSGRSGFRSYVPLTQNLLLSRERQFTKALGSSRPREIDLFAPGGSSSIFAIFPIFVTRPPTPSVWWFHGSSAAGNLWRSAFSSVYLSGRSGFRSYVPLTQNLLLSRERQFTKALGSSRPREIDLFAPGGSSSFELDRVRGPDVGKTYVYYERSLEVPALEPIALGSRRTNPCPATPYRMERETA
ncbi:hypothetical protein DFP72DRAFT_1052206 [Ephemerocybe angulata]|uniref:Uncharacterized protein n=1 Tax=Ephemerocybe angulata TaxID=980116 RepID=A0A8H6HEI3_9AGAR|nr:hypothetical protein DFP72DRAFT_1052206 [Tulosesus angulatus]